MEEKVSVILVNYNGKIYNNKCIASILQSTVKDRLQVVVVDNASTDDSLSDLKIHWGQNDQVAILEMDQNYGFSKANNEGIKWSVEHGIYKFLLLNNDTEVKENAIEEMLKVQRETKGIVVPKIYYADKPNIIWCAGGEFSTLIRKPRQRGINRKDNGQYDKNCKCKFANGCCLLLSKETIDIIGLLDERFFLYYEDTEYSFRALEHKIPIWYCSAAVIYHKVNGSTEGNRKPSNVYYITRNWLICNRMHMKERFPIYFLYFLVNRIIWILIWSLKRKPEMNIALIRGIKDFFSGIDGYTEF